MKKWTKEESDELVRIVERSWDWIWIGWEQVKLKLETDFPNGRSKNAIRQKYNSILTSGL